MARYIERGELLFIPFKNGKSITDSQLKPRMYKSVQNFEKTFPKHNCGTQNIELVEYAEVKHGAWIEEERGMFFSCSNCGYLIEYLFTNYCPNCGAKMDGGKE